MTRAKNERAADELDDPLITKSVDHVIRAALMALLECGRSPAEVREGLRKVADEYVPRVNSEDRALIIETLKTMIRDPELSVAYSPALIAAIRFLKHDAERTQ